MAQLFNSPSVWQPFGAFSMGAVLGSGRLVHLKGQVALDRDGALVGEGDMGAQVRKTLENIQAVLSDLGGGMADIVSLFHFTTDIEAFMACGEVRMAFFQEPYPVTTTIEVSRLYDPRLLIEITAAAEIPVERFRAPR